MKFRPCIDIHNGKVKQIVGSSLRDDGDRAQENFVAERSAASFAEMFREDGLTGGHVILLNGKDSPFYAQTAAQARAALEAYPGGLQIGGGITAENAAEWIRDGASHVIVTSYVFRDGQTDFDHLAQLESAVGKEHIVLDLSCRRKADEEASPYYICTDRWQKYTDTPLDSALMKELAGHCDEFLVHGIAVEGKGSGIDTGLVSLLAGFASGRATSCRCFPITYAGGIRSAEDIALIGSAGGGLLDYTVGSALDLYGGTLPYRTVAAADFLLNNQK